MNAASVFKALRWPLVAVTVFVCWYAIAVLMPNTGILVRALVFIPVWLVVSFVVNSVVPLALVFVLAWFDKDE